VLTPLDSAFVGLAAIILFIPAPVLVTKLSRRVQEVKSEKMDARVGFVTEGRHIHSFHSGIMADTGLITPVLNVLRMVKLFGWEEKMKGRIGRKRNSELVWTRKRMMANLFNMIVKYAHWVRFINCYLGTDNFIVL
jgi:hypothetical protein